MGNALLAFIVFTLMSHVSYVIVFTILGFLTLFNTYQCRRRTHSKTHNHTSQNRLKSTNSMASGPIPLSALRPGYRGEVVAMVVRKWNIYVGGNTYLGTDYILADVCGNVLHCTSRSDVAQPFARSLKVGDYISCRGIGIKANLETFRVVAMPAYMLELYASTKVRIIPSPPAPIRCPYFDLKPIKKIVPDAHNTLVDVIGLVTDLKDVIKREKKSTNNLKRDTQSLDFFLQDNLGARVRVTMWESKVEEFLDQQPMDENNWVVVLVGMNPHKFKSSVCLSSTSATQIFTDDKIAEIATFKGTPPAEIVTGPTPDMLSLAELVEWCRARKQHKIFKVKISISDIDHQRGWFYLACTNEGCKKAVSPHPLGYFCKFCKVKIENPVHRYRLKINVHDEFTTGVVTMFDRPMNQLLGVDASTLDKNNQEEGVIGGFPDLLLDLINTSHVLEIPSNTFEDEDPVGFTCYSVFSSVHPKTHEQPERTNPRAQGIVIRDDPTPAVPTPRKQEAGRGKSPVGVPSNDHKKRKFRGRWTLADDEEDTATSAIRSSTNTSD